jgi:hypothetical protein
MDRQRQCLFKIFIFLVCAYAILNAFFLLRQSQFGLKVNDTTYVSQTAQRNVINSKGTKYFI